MNQMRNGKKLSYRSTPHSEIISPNAFDQPRPHIETQNYADNSDDQHYCLNG